MIFLGGETKKRALFKNKTSFFLHRFQGEGFFQAAEIFLRKNEKRKRSKCVVREQKKEGNGQKREKTTRCFEGARRRRPFRIIIIIFSLLPCPPRAQPNKKRSTARETILTPSFLLLLLLCENYHTIPFFSFFLFLGSAPFVSCLVKKAANKQDLLLFSSSFAFKTRGS